MTVRKHIEVRCQYASIAEALEADTWLNSWKLLRGASIRPAGTSQTCIALIPPVSDDYEQPTAYGEFDATIHIEVADDATADSLEAEVGAALADGSPLQSVQTSSVGSAYE